MSSQLALAEAIADLAGPMKWGVIVPSFDSDYITDEIGWRFASLADGEGCFSIHKSTTTGSWDTSFQINIRWDDRPFLDHIRYELGHPGVIRRTEPKFRPNDPNRRPQAYWRISGKAQALWLTTVLDRYPLWSKKGRDYSVWREAVRARSLGRGAGFDVLERCFHEIRRVREYVEPPEEICQGNEGAA